MHEFLNSPAFPFNNPHPPSFSPSSSPHPQRGNIGFKEKKKLNSWKLGYNAILYMAMKKNGIVSQLPAV
jgi:hypothetical protein